MFYVYEWFIVDTLEVFYVGKGTGKRRFELHNRNSYFKNIYSKYKCEVRLVHQYLTNEEACQLEIERIAHLKSIGQAKCNFTAGGTGFSVGELNPIHKRIKSPDYVNPFSTLKLEGEMNPFFGKSHSESTKRKISQSRKGKGGQVGENNPMWKSKRFEGENNGMFGRTGLKHPNSKMYSITYQDGTVETLTYKQCEKKFGIAFSRIFESGGTLQYKKKCKAKELYEGLELIRLK